jgi:uncharacterized protein
VSATLSPKVGDKGGAPGGAFGVAILEVTDEAEARQFGENDPSVRAGLNRFEFYPMHVARARVKS